MCAKIKLLPLLRLSTQMFAESIPFLRKNAHDAATALCCFWMCLCIEDKVD